MKTFFKDQRKNSKKRDQIEAKTFFLENIKFRKALPRAPNFEYPPLFGNKKFVQKNFAARFLTLVYARGSLGAFYDITTNALSQSPLALFIRNAFCINLNQNGHA